MGGAKSAYQPTLVQTGRVSKKTFAPNFFQPEALVCLVDLVPEGEPSAFWSGAPPTTKEDWGRGESRA